MSQDRLAFSDFGSIETSASLCAGSFRDDPSHARGQSRLAVRSYFAYIFVGAEKPFQSPPGKISIVYH